MKCLSKYKWVKVPRDEIPDDTGILIYYLRLASRAAFRKGFSRYCGHKNAVEAGSWAGGVVGLKSILKAKSRRETLEIMDELKMLGYIDYTIDPSTKKLTYSITDWVIKCSGKECPNGNVYTTPKYGFLCMPRNITERLVEKGHLFGEADAWLDLWCHTVFRDKGNAFSFLAPAIQYGKYGSVLTLETLGKRWKWEKTKVWRFFRDNYAYFALHRLPGAYGCVLQVSRVAMWLEKCGVPTFSERQDTEEPYFIPSACWRKIALGILSTTRFAGMLMAYDKRYAVYDIGDGNMEWQVRAESSLFYYRYGSFETKAHGMILICEDCRRDEIAKQIIRQTMWSRKSLLKEQYSETNKPVRYSRSPIKLRAQYEHVYLTTPALLATSLKRIYDEEETIETTIDDGERAYNPKEGNWVDWPNRYFLNPAFDILLLVYFFSAAKSLQHLLMGEWADHFSELKYILCVHQEDLEIAKMYPDVTGMKEVSMYVYRPDEDTEAD